MRTEVRNGFTLPELLVGMAIQVIALYVILSVMGQSSDTYETTSRVARIQQETRQAIDAVSAELRLAERTSLLITQQNGSDRVDFRLPLGWTGDAVTWSTNISFRIVPSTLDANRNGVADDGMLVREQDGRQRVLCQHVPLGGLAFERTGDNVSITLSLADFDGVSRRLLAAPAVTSVTLRN